MDAPPIRSAKDRHYAMIPVDKVEVVHSRQREKTQFKDNVRSIGAVGLYKPILVNQRFLAKTGMYHLICGEGRLTAHKELGKTEIQAEIIDVDETTALLMTLGENIARTPVESIEYGYILKEMKDYGMSLAELSAITGRDEAYLRRYLRLIEQGEERLIKGVEDGVFPLVFAINVAQSNDRSVQHLLMDAFDNGIVNTTNLARVRRIVEDRMENGKQLRSGKRPEPVTVDRLKTEIRQITREKTAFVYEANQKENRLFRLLMAVRQLREDEDYVSLLKAEGLDEEPVLKGSYQL